MNTQRPTLQKKKLVIALSLAMLGGAMAGCSSSSSSGSGPKGVFNILATGGTAGSQCCVQGGDGGYMTLNNHGGTRGVEVRENGLANTKFTPPKLDQKVNLGDNPLTIATDTNIAAVDYSNPVSDGGGSFLKDDLYVDDADRIRVVAADGPAVYLNDTYLATGTLYQRYGTDDPRVYVVGGDVAASDAHYSGVSVAAGATLTLNDIYDCGAGLGVENDIENNGTITSAALSCDMDLYADKYIASGDIMDAGTATSVSAGRVTITAATGIANSGTINASGFDNVDPTTGGPGGNANGITLSAGGYVLNNGTLIADGGDGKGAGGSAYVNSISLNAAYVENNGAIDHSGGNNTDVDNTAGNGGSGGYGTIAGDYVTNNTGDIDFSGGDGSVGGSVPSSTSIQNSSNSFGEVKNSGTVNLSGGVGHTSSGGYAGTLYIRAYGGKALNSGDVNLIGGDSMGTGTSGGSGGILNVYSYAGGNAMPRGDIEVSGNLNVSGGNAAADGGYGGDAGHIYMNIDGAEGTDSINNQRLALLGYVSIDAHGGDGYNGGEGGGWSNGIVFDTYSVLNQQTQKYTIGSVLNEVPIIASGGNSTADPLTETAMGGDGGEVTLYISAGDEVRALHATVSNSGDINVDAGTGVGTNSGNGGNGGSLVLYGYHGADNSGMVTANGATGGYTGGYGGGLHVYAQAGPAKNTGDLSANGADGAHDGGHGGSVYVWGKSGTNTADLSLNGGNATNPGTIFSQTYGGDGGQLTVLGAGLNGSAKNTGTISYTAGTGIIDGIIGCVQIGAFDFEGICNNN